MPCLHAQRCLLLCRGAFCACTKFCERAPPTAHALGAAQAAVLGELAEARRAEQLAASDKAHLRAGFNARDVELVRLVCRASHRTKCAARQQELI